MIPISKPYIGEEEKQLVMEVLNSGMLAQGPKVAALEKRFAELSNVKHAIATSSGTTALHIALLAHGIDPAMRLLPLHSHSLLQQAAFFSPAQRQFLWTLMKTLLTLIQL